MKKAISLILGIIVVSALLFVAYYYTEVKTYTYYSRIDNTKITKLKSADTMKYEYKLIMYDENGKSKEISFKNSRELKDKAYLKVKYLLVSGVNNWEELKYEELPPKVQSKYKD